MAVDLKALRQLIQDVGGEVKLYGGHIADPNHPCECRGIVDEVYAGGIATIHVDNGIESLADGGNQCPPKEVAVAYMNLLVGAANALPELLDMLEARDAH